MHFQYGEKELAYLKKKDKRLAAAIEQIGMIERVTDDDLFASVVHHIVGQQISSKAQATIWGRLQNYLGSIEAQNVNAASAEALQSLGMSMRKALYIKDFAAKVVNGSFDLDAVQHMGDKEAIEALRNLKGIGVWTAEMILLFCLQRRDILSFDDLAIQRGLRMLYHHRKITKELFAKYRRRYTPYGSIASLYLWAIAGGAIEGMKDYGAQKKINKKK
ncbi:DNA-3-methyladenine glycosylase 2 family protein [uncultured Phascolarctobacterium sp.]|uniref:DNA-3-methyladenine glycosylase family protein n=1 Tax=uncultured Phascolarctobacterium sp. TaxID=512296 RepID=UPI0025ECC5D2|nr:DNA-3-methyladenine glycosylase 2 family protein [uncultured Phascolarctobacterium sp.]